MSTLTEMSELTQTLFEAASSLEKPLGKKEKHELVLSFFSKLKGVISALREEISSWRESVFRGMAETTEGENRSLHGSLAILYSLGAGLLKKSNEKEILESSVASSLLSYLDQIKKECEDWKIPTRSLSPALCDLDFLVQDWPKFEEAVRTAPSRPKWVIPEVAKGDPDELLGLIK